MNYLDIVIRAKKETGLAGPVPTSVLSTVGDTSRIAGWVTDVHRDIQLMPRNWKWMRASVQGQVTVAGGMAYTIDDLLNVASGTTSFKRWRPSSRYYRPTAFDPSNPGNIWEMKWVEYDNWRSMFLSGSTTAGPPQFWSISDNGTVAVGPTPDKSYGVNFEYVKGLQTLVNDVDIPLMPEDYHMLLVWGAVAQYGGYDASPEALNRAQDNYRRLLNTLVDEQAEKPRLVHLSL